MGGRKTGDGYVHYLAMVPPPLHITYIYKFQSMIDNKFILIYTWSVLGDIMTGFFKSLNHKSTNSTKGLNGLFKHAALMLLILTLYPMLDLLKWDTMADAFICFYILFYVVSIIENLGQMGIPVPEWLKKYIYKLSDEYNENDFTKKK